PGPQGADLAQFQRLRGALQGMDLTPLLQFQAARRSLQDLDPHGFGTLMRNARVVSNLHQFRKLLDLDVRGLQELQERLRRLQDVDLQALLDSLPWVDARAERDHAASQDMQSEGGPAEPASAAPRRAAA